jgi:hypothetical protein
MSLSIKKEYVQWLKNYDWHWFCTLTFSNLTSRSRAVGLFNKWLAALRQWQGYAPISFVCAIESGCADHRLHIHALLAGVHGIDMNQARMVWGRFAGHAEISSYDPNGKALGYTLKSLEKSNDADIDFDLYPEHQLVESSDTASTLSSAAHAATASVPDTAPAPEAPVQQPAAKRSSTRTYASRHQARKQRKNTASGRRHCNKQKWQSPVVNPGGDPTFDAWFALHQSCHVAIPPFDDFDPEHTMPYRWRGHGSLRGYRLFRHDMGERPTPWHELRRIDQDACYGPDNCKWVDTRTKAKSARSKTR